MSQLKNKIGWITAASLVIANMIGTGVFTSLGFQLLEVQNTWSIVIAWVIGGCMALAGAMIYAELGTHFKKTGGDYIFLSQTLHPIFGYLYSWVSLTVGFSAPIAIAAMAMNQYLTPWSEGSIIPGLLAIVLIPLVHVVSIHRSALFQNTFTLLKVLFILVLVSIGFAYLGSPQQALDFSNTWQKEIFKPSYAISLVYVFYAYTGWNSAAYIVGEIRSPEKNLPKALITASILVTILYVLFQVVLLKHASLEQLSGKVEVSEIAFGNLFGSTGAKLIAFMIALQLIATISGYAWIGPRITQAMAKDYRLWLPISKQNKNEIPVRAILLNMVISLLIFLSGSFDQIMLYAGFVLQLMGTITVYSSLKIKSSNGFKAPFRPWLQLIYLFLSSLILIYLLWERPTESLWGLALILAGILLFVLDKKTSKV
ncbi:APC family permease [Algoriphagus namhaensis]|uniref:APC family permease n=1 Tax=Algoriphagus namhaensis TaxID=915353 RepID=A0ABV8AUA1_9BACT